MTIPAPGWQLARLRDVPVGARYRYADDESDFKKWTNSYIASEYLGKIVEWRPAVPDLVSIEVELHKAWAFRGCWKNFIDQREDILPHDAAALDLLPAVIAALEEE